jgi:hypothetical protein
MSLFVVHTSVHNLSQMGAKIEMELKEKLCVEHVSKHKQGGC